MATPRLPPLDRAALSAEQRQLLDAIEGGPRGRVGLEGPFGVWLRAPALGGPTQALGAAVRYAGTLPDAIRELTICTVGAYYRARFEFVVHARLAHAAGVEASVLEALRTGASPALEGDAAVAHELASRLLREHRLDDADYDRGIAAFGEAGMVELVTVVGYYVLVSMTLNAFAVPLPDGADDPFPEAP